VRTLDALRSAVRRALGSPSGERRSTDRRLVDRRRLEAAAIAALAALGLVSALQLPADIATHPLVGLTVVGVIAGSVVSVIAITRRWQRCWLLAGAVFSFGIVGYAVGRADHLVRADAYGAISILLVPVLLYVLMPWPTRHRH
jgi:uncharacterized membrane protein YfcA